MQDHSLGHSGAVAPDPVEHLDLATAELRRRIAGIGLAIAELREETGRLRASADGRYHAVAVLDRPLEAELGASGADTGGPPQPMVIDQPVVTPADSSLAGDLRLGSGLTQPVSPWGEPTIGIVDTAPAVGPASMPGRTDGGGAAPAGSVAGSAVVEPTLTWIPEPTQPAAFAPAVVPVAPAATAATDIAVDGVSVTSDAVTPLAPVASVVPSPVAPAEVHADGQLPSLWADGDDDDTAAFEAFFSAEIEPEPSQRWLLSD